MKPKTRYCDECRWFSEHYEVVECGRGHRLRFYQPRSTLDTNFGWKRRCADFVSVKENVLEREILNLMNNEMRCKTCVHWDKLEAPRPTSRDQGGTGQSPKMRESYGDASYEPDALVYPYDEGGYFLTGPDFGCVHYERKP